MQATPIPPYSNGFFQLVSGCTQRVLFLEGATFIGPSLAYLPSSLASVTFFLFTNLLTYKPTYSSNLSTLFFELSFYLLTCLPINRTTYLYTYLATYAPTFLSPTMFTYLPLFLT
jgi:hypothetical protein